MDINLGGKTADLLVESYSTADIFDLLSLSVEQLLALPKFGQKKAQTLYDSIQSVKGCSYDKLVVLLQPRDIGRSIAKTLVAELGVKALDAETVRGFKLKGTSCEVFADFADLLEARAEEVGRMIEWLEPTAPAAETAEAEEGAANNDGTLNGEVIVLTGKMEHPRSHYEALIRANGGVAGDKINAETTVLLTAEEGSTSSKAKAAAKKGINVCQVNVYLKEKGIAV